MNKAVATLAVLLAISTNVLSSPLVSNELTISTNVVSSPLVSDELTNREPPAVGNRSCASKRTASAELIKKLTTIRDRSDESRSAERQFGDDWIAANACLIAEKAGEKLRPTGRTKIGGGTLYELRSERERVYCRLECAQQNVANGENICQYLPSPLMEACFWLSEKEMQVCQFVCDNF